MTTAETAAAAVTGVTEEQLTALVEGRWQDYENLDTPCWKRAVVVGGKDRWIFQEITPFIAADGSSVRWDADSGGTHSGGEHICVNSLDEALAWCDQRAVSLEIDDKGTATKQENRFARMVADG